MRKKWMDWRMERNFGMKTEKDWTNRNLMKICLENRTNSRKRRISTRSLITLGKSKKCRKPKRGNRRSWIVKAIARKMIRTATRTAIKKTKRSAAP